MAVCTFDAEPIVGIAHGDDAPVGQTDADAEQTGIHVGQIGDVMGVLAALQVFARGVGIFDGGFQLVEGDRLDHGGLLGTGGGAWASISDDSHHRSQRRAAANGPHPRWRTVSEGWDGLMRCASSARRSRFATHWVANRAEPIIARS